MVTVHRGEAPPSRPRGGAPASQQERMMTRGLDALTNWVVLALPPPRDATLAQRETEAEQEANFGRDRRHRYFDPYIHRFNPYKAWRKTLLVL
jgi:hypothetical protein